MANAKNMQSDVLISFSVLVGLTATFIFKMPLLDLVTAFAVSAWIMTTALKIFIESGRDLMDGVDDTEVYKKVITACRKIKEVSHPHHMRVRKMAHLNIIALDIELPRDIPLQEAHAISHQVEKEIHKNVKNVYDVVVHTEPKDCQDDGEAFGVSEKSL